MTPVSLKAFLHEYKVTFPVGVDLAHESGMPQTMRGYQMQGTPTLILIDPRAGCASNGSARPMTWWSVQKLCDWCWNVTCLRQRHRSSAMAYSLIQ